MAAELHWRYQQALCRHRAQGQRTCSVLALRHAHAVLCCDFEQRVPALTCFCQAFICAAKPPCRARLASPGAGHSEDGLLM